MRGVRWVAAAVAAAACAGGAPAQVLGPPIDRRAVPADEPVEVDTSSGPAELPAADPAVVTRLIAQLDDAELSARESATQALASLPGIVYADVERALLSGELSPEARLRAEAVAGALLGATPRAAMGVQFDTGFGVGGAVGVRISRLVQEGKFPARSVLREGDVIVGIDGEAVSRELFRHIIVSHDPGDVMRVEVERAGERLTLEVGLGSFEDLSGSPGLDLGTLRAAVRERLRRVTGGGGRAGGPIVRTPEAGAWAEAAFGGPGCGPDGGGGRAAPGDARVRVGALMAGGRSAREAGVGLWSVRPLGSFAMPVVIAEGGPANLPPARRSARMAELARVRALLLQQNRAAEARAVEIGLTAGQRALVQAEILDRAEWIARIDAEMQALTRTPTPEEVEAWDEQP
jgi:hypothetical protein